MPGGLPMIFGGSSARGVDTAMWPNEPDDFESLQRPPEERSGESWHFMFLGQELLSTSQGGIPQPLDGDAVRWLDVEVLSEHYMGEYRGRSCYAVDASGRAPEGYATSDLRGWLGRVDSPVFYLAGRARQIIDWHNTNLFCGRCGGETVEHHTDRAKYCGGCRNIIYPRLSPSIIVLITKGDEMLLARNAAWPSGFYSTLAGFVEPGESVEQTLHREVFEEVGLKVKNLRYMGSQSWPFPNSLMLGYHAEYDSGDIVCQDDEIADARWFRYDDPPNMPPGTAISRWLIDHFIEERQAG